MISKYLDVSSTGVNGNESTHSWTVTGDLLRGDGVGEGVHNKVLELPALGVSTTNVGTFEKIPPSSGIDCSKESASSRGRCWRPLSPSDEAYKTKFTI